MLQHSTLKKRGVCVFLHLLVLPHKKDEVSRFLKEHCVIETPMNTHEGENSGATITRILVQQKKKKQSKFHLQSAKKSD